MFAMPGMRGFSLSERCGRGVSCDADGVFVGEVPLLRHDRGSFGLATWSARPSGELNAELSALYRLPIDAATKVNALALIAVAFNRGDLAMAAIATAQMQFPNPPPLAKGVEADEQLVRRAAELRRSGLLKFWDPAKHPRAGVPPNPGQFAPVGGGSESAEVIPAAMLGNPWDKPPMLEGGGGGGVPRGQLELPFPRGLPRLRWPGGSQPEPPSTAPKPSLPSEPQPKLPYPDQPPQLAPYKGGPTSGIFRAGDLTVELQSGADGPASGMPRGSAGFDGYTREHVEGHAAALMQRYGIMEGTLEINHPRICTNCLENLPRMLPPGATLRIVLPDGSVREFKGEAQ